VAWATRAALAAVLTLSLLALGRPQDGAPSPGESARPQAVPAFRLAPQVVVIPIRGEIDARGIMARSVARRIALAERARADAIVFEIDSPGGEVDSVLRICRAIKSSSISNTVAWINSDAYSGAALVALACREIIINDPVALGDAKPIAGGPLGMPRSVPPDLLRKVLPPLVAEVTESVRRHNDAMGRYEWDEYLAKAIIVDDMQLWAVRHRQTGVMVCIDPDEFRLLFPGQDPGGPTRLASLSGSLRGSQDTPSPAEGIPAGSPKLQAVAKEIEAQTPQGTASRRPRFTPADAGEWDLVEKVLDGSGPAVLRGEDLVFFGWVANAATVKDGRRYTQPVRTTDDLKGFFQATRIRTFDRDWSEAMVLVMTNIVVRFGLIVVFLIAMFIEVTHPGATLPGIIALAALLGLIAPPMLVGMASWWAVVAIITGIVMLLIEVFVTPGFGAPGVFGLILLFMGLVGVFVPTGNGLLPSSPEARGDLLYYSAAVMLAMATAAVGIYFVARHFGTLPGLRRLVLQDPNRSEDALSFLDTMGEPEAQAVRVGEVGVVITPMRPAGRVELNGRVVDAVAEFGMIQAGQRVRVTSVDGVRIGVEAIDTPAGGSA
jgi:membrane-bound ClpP family serine protease